MKDEMRGLEVILSTSSNLHRLEEPPEREDFKSEEEFQKEYLEWQRRASFWKGKYNG